MWSKSLEVLNPYEAIKESAEQERSRKYGCDGVCYTSTSMCPRAEICPETRRTEFGASVAAAIVVFAVPAAVVAAIIYWICSCL